MKRLKGLLLVFCMALSIPLAYFVWRTYRSLEQEETAQLRYFAETLFDDMERELAMLVRQEEERAVDEYNYYFTPVAAQKRIRSPLSRPPEMPFILGYFQNNPDGSFQTPLTPPEENAAMEAPALADTLRTVNRLFNKKRASAEDLSEAQPFRQPIPSPAPPPAAEPGFADRFLSRSRAKEQKKASLGQQERRTEAITRDQALNLVRQEKEAAAKDESRLYSANRYDAPWEDAEEALQEAAPSPEIAGAVEAEPVETLRAEVDPMQSVAVDENRLFIFRRVALGNRIYRQGFVVETEAFLDYLVGAHFSPQPLSRFTHLVLTVSNGSEETALRHAGAPGYSRFRLERTFPRPFSFLHATLTCQEIPRSPGRQTLTIMIAVLAVIMLAGLFAIYRSARTIADLSERRSKFVSSVTHELKTPLTNIRMYMEMLEQGIARTPEREQEYFRIVESESTRLSRLINNILEFSKLERKQIHFNRVEGTLDEVIEEVRQLTGEALRQAGYRLTIDHDLSAPFAYDREIMTQVLINLVENSVKFGRKSQQKDIRIETGSEGKRVRVSVSDTGPGIPRKALNKVFDDFYRVESALVRETRGTGIGLAFVRKVITAMGGRVYAENNDGPGCTITLLLDGRCRQVH